MFKHNLYVILNWGLANVDNEKVSIENEIVPVTKLGFHQLEEVTKKLSKVTEDPHKLPQASEAVIADISVGKDGSKLEGCPAHIPHFQTPPSSPSSLGSRYKTI